MKTYQENYDGPNKIISHCDTDTEAQFIYNGWVYTKYPCAEL